MYIKYLLVVLTFVFLMGCTKSRILKRKQVFTTEEFTLYPTPFADSTLSANKMLTIPAKVLLISLEIEDAQLESAEIGEIKVSLMNSSSVSFAQLKSLTLQYQLDSTWIDLSQPFFPSDSSTILFLESNKQNLLEVYAQPEITIQLAAVSKVPITDSLVVSLGLQHIFKNFQKTE